MKKLSELVPVASSEFELVDPDDCCKVRSNQIKPMVIHSFIFFKMVPEHHLISFMNKDHSIQYAFKCSHDHCNCYFIVKKDGSGGIIGNHDVELDE